MRLRTTFLNLAVILSLLLGGAIVLDGPQVLARVAEPETQQPAASAALPLVDDFEAGLPAGQDGAVPIGFNTFADPNSTAAISTTDAIPAPSVPGRSAGNHVLKLDLTVVAWAGVTHAFEDAGATTWVTQDWSAYEGISFYLYGTGTGTDLFMDVLDNRNPGSTKDDAERWSVAFKDDFTGWKLIELPFAGMNRKEIGNGAPNDGFGLTEVHGWGFGTLGTDGAKSYYIDDVSVYGVAPIKPLTVGFSTLNYLVTEGETATITAKLSKPYTDTVTVHYATTFGLAVPDRDYLPTSGTLTFPPSVTEQSFAVQTNDDAKFQGERGVLLELSNPTGGLAMGFPPIARVNILDNEMVYPPLLDDFETYPYLWSATPPAALSNPEIAAGDPLALPGQGAYEHVLQVGPKSRIYLPLIGGIGPAAAVQQPSASATYHFGRTFPIGQDWSAASALSFWYYGRNSDESVQVALTNDQATPADPAGWKLVWSDEFNGASGAAPDARVWGNEVGDGTAYGIPGWGNDELEYYTPGGENAAADGQGNLVITTEAADGSLQCYYGPCKYTSARLLTKNRFEVAYGRVEARVKVPVGAGLWPAFWMLGTDIDRVSWPMTGEIDIMEHVGRLPNEIFGTLHGPGYSGGNSYGKVVDLGKPVADDFHTFAVEWQPDKITWFLDGAPYFTATPSDPFLAGKQWVYNHPFYMLLNVAVGGNFGGAVGSETTFPQETLVDYVRLYQAAPEPVSFAASFVDDFNGWQQISLPFTSFQGAAGTALDLAAVRSLSFAVPAATREPVLLDQVRLTYDDTTPPAVEITSSAAGETAKGPVTFSFTFSEDVGTSFAADDVAVAGGTAGAFTRVSGTLATLVVTPPANATGTMTVSVAAGKFYDAAYNANTAPASLDQAYDTTSVMPPAWEPITFDDSAVTYTLTGFGGADASTVVVDPTDAANKVAKVVKSGTAELWAGTTVSTGPNFSVPALPFTANDTTMTVRVWSPDAGIPVRLKVEDAADGTKSVETEAMTTVAAGWETLTFNFANPAPGTAALNLAYTYNKASIFFNFGVTGAAAGEKTYYFDDVAFAGGTPPPAWEPITFDDPAVTYTLTGFGGADASTVVVDPTDAANKVAKVIKSATAELWAGTTVSTGPNFSVPALPFTASDTTMTVRVWSPDAGIPVRLKVEDAADGTKSVETEAMTTVAAGWETLTFNFANPAPGTAALNLAYTYNKASIFFNFGVTGAAAGEKTYYFDDVTFGP